MSMKNERLQILEMVDSGVITPEEGARLLGALEGDPLPTVDEGSPSSSNVGYVAANGFLERISLPDVINEGPAPEIEDETNERVFDPDLGYWRRWWMIPMWIGIAITVAGGALMFLALQTSGIGFWFGCAWLPFLLGVGVMALAWASRTSRWLHLRIHRKPGESPQTILLSIPLPLGIAAWFLRMFGKRIPGFQNTSVDELILALGKNTGPGNPFYIEVNEGEDGERVQIYIG
jgi:hypothetical protein